MEQIYSRLLIKTVRSVRHSSLGLYGFKGFFFQDGTIMAHMDSMSLKNQNWVQKLTLLWIFSNQDFNTSSNMQTGTHKLHFAHVYVRMWRPCWE